MKKCQDPEIKEKKFGKFQCLDSRSFSLGGWPNPQFDCILRCEKNVSDLLTWHEAILMNTLPETNGQFAPENQWLEDEFPFGMAYF